MTIQIFGIAEFLAMTNPNAGKEAMAERDHVRSFVYDMNFQQAVANGVDEDFVLLYAQCALLQFDRGNIQ